MFFFDQIYPGLFKNQFPSEKDRNYGEIRKNLSYLISNYFRWNKLFNIHLYVPLIMMNYTQL